MNVWLYYLSFTSIPRFGVYLLERVDELLSGGFTVSDTWLVQAAGLRFTKEELTQILEQHETQHI